MALITRLFPVWAIISAVLAWNYPALFADQAGAIVPLLTLIMFGMGMTLTFSSFKGVRQAPMKVVAGTAMQFLIMPLSAFLIAGLFDLSGELTAGLILVGCCPGGTASNVVCYLGRGDVALSITLTMVSTMFSVLLTPFLSWFYLGQAVEVPLLEMMLSILQIVIVPVLAGVVINSYFSAPLARLQAFFPALSVLAIVLIIGIVVGLNRDSFAVVGLSVVLAVVAHNLTGLAGAYGLGLLLRYDARTCRTLALEVGMQNSGLGVALASQFFSAAATLPGAVFSLWHNLSGSMFAAWWSRDSQEVDDDNR